jgi:hypothetical protein
MNGMRRKGKVHARFGFLEVTSPIKRFIAGGCELETVPFGVLDFLGRTSDGDL